MLSPTAGVHTVYAPVILLHGQAQPQSGPHLLMCSIDSRGYRTCRLRTSTWVLGTVVVFEYDVCRESRRRWRVAVQGSVAARLVGFFAGFGASSPWSHEAWIQWKTSEIEDACRLGAPSVATNSALYSVRLRDRLRQCALNGRSGMYRHLLGIAFAPRPSVHNHRRAVHTVCSGPVRKFKKCRFQAHVADVVVEDDVKGTLAAIVASDKKVAKATHSAIAAWRLDPASSSLEPLAGYDDCGESGAGKRLLQLLQARGDTNTLVAVTRWYGGKPLGGARFRQITNAANELLTERDSDRAG